MMSLVREFLASAWLMIAEMGIYLLIGFAASALLHRWLKQVWIERYLGGRGLRPIVWGSVVGVPMPLCSCGVIPVTMSLRDKGASRGATISFLTSTPQTGVDSILATAGMLGPVFALYKVVVAFLSGIGVGLFVEAFTPAPSKTAAAPAFQKARPANPFSPMRPVAAKALPAPSKPQPTWKESFRYGFITMPGDLASALFLGFVIAALISTFAPENFFAQLPGGTLASILLITVFSVPFYICSTGSIPLALALVQGGLPISAALVLLVAGPATNIATITAMRKILGGRQTYLYVAGIVLCSWIAAGAYEIFFTGAELTQHAMDHPDTLSWWKQAGGVALLVLLVAPYLGSKLPKRSPVTQSAPLAPGSQVATIELTGMTCGHCESSVKDGLNSLPFTERVISVDRQAGIAVLHGKEINEASIRQKIESLGFEYKGIKIA